MNPFRPLTRPLGQVSGWVARRTASRVPAADLDARDPRYIADSVALGALIARFYFRADVRGIEHIPAEGPVLLVSNHSGGNVPPEALVTAVAFVRRFGVKRPFYQLAHNLVMAYPLVGSLLRRLGTVAASPENARKALRSGAVVLVYPGGDWEVHRPTWEENRIEFAGRKGFLRLAWEEHVPIVPVVNIGAQESELILTRGDRLAHALHLDTVFRLKVFPISLALPWGLDVSDLAGHIPLPAKITVEVLEPIDLHATFGDTEDLDAMYDHVTGLMQAKLTELAAERRFPLIG